MGGRAVKQGSTGSKTSRWSSTGSKTKGARVTRKIGPRAGSSDLLPHAMATGIMTSRPRGVTD